MSSGAKKLEASKKDGKEEKSGIKITGLRSGKENARNAVEDLLSNNMGMGAKVVETKVITKAKKPIIIVKLGSGDQKQQVMKNKHKLKGSVIYINYDVTVEEQTEDKDVEEKSQYYEELENSFLRY